MSMDYIKKMQADSAAWWDLLKSARAQIAELGARLEIDQRYPYDGIASRDVTIRELEAQVRGIEAAYKHLFAAAPAPAAGKEEKEAEQRKRMEEWFSKRAATPATADFDLPYAGDAAGKEKP